MNFLNNSEQYTQFHGFPSFQPTNPRFSLKSEPFHLKLYKILNKFAFLLTFL